MYWRQTLKIISKSKSVSNTLLLAMGTMLLGQISQGNIAEAKAPYLGSTTATQQMGAYPANAPVTNRNATPANTQSVRLRCKNALRMARLALVNGDTVTATKHYNNAVAMGNIPFSPSEDSTQKVLRDIKSFAGIQASNPNSPTYHQQLAIARLNLSSALLEYKEWDTAERLARAAGMSGMSFDSFTITPAMVLRRIQVERANAANAANAVVAQRTETNKPRKLPQPTAPAGTPNSTVLKQYNGLLKQARAELNAGQLQNAYTLAMRARQLGVVPSQLPKVADNAEIVLKEIAYRNGQGTPVTQATHLASHNKTGQPAYAKQGVYSPATDQTRIVPASATQIRLGQTAKTELGFATPATPRASAPPSLPKLPAITGATPAKASNPSIPKASLAVGTTASQPAASTAELIATPTPLPAPVAPTNPVASGITSTPKVLLPTTQGNVSSEPKEVQRKKAVALLNDARVLLTNQKAKEAEAKLVELRTYRDQLTSPEKKLAANYLDTSRNMQRKAMTSMTQMPIDSQSDERMRLATFEQDLNREITQAVKLSKTDYPTAKKKLDKLRESITQESFSPHAQRQMFANVDRNIKYITAEYKKTEHLHQLDNYNKQMQAEQRAETQAIYKNDAGLKKLINEHNRLLSEHKFADALLVAQKAHATYPSHPITKQLLFTSQTMRELTRQREMRDRGSQGFMYAMNDVQRSSLPPLGDYTYGENFLERTGRRRSVAAERTQPATRAELNISAALDKPHKVSFVGNELMEVIDYIQEMANINVNVDWDAAERIGVTKSKPINFVVSSDPMKLKNILRHILEPLGMGSTITNETLLITDKESCKSKVFTQMYYVADLVSKIPNFRPDRTENMGTQYQTGLNAISPNNNGSMFNGVTQTNFDGNPQASPEDIQRQMGLPGTGQNGNLTAEFDALKQLIMNTVEPESWAEGPQAMGTGQIEPFPINYSLVVSNTQEVHEKLTDLLEQLRRLQDLQVTIEVRYITLTEDFFERIGVDFDFNVHSKADPNDYTIEQMVGGSYARPNNPYQAMNDAVGASDNNLIDTNLKLRMMQDNFTSAVPQFGAYNASSGASLGFAILSDIESFFFVQAAQGDTRSNILQAPKVTLFNGQQAFVSDTSQTPFVISVVPTVGNYAAAHQPVIVILNEGTQMTVKAVVSADRRYVRLTVVPFFSEITDVDTFTFDGEDTTREVTATSDVGAVVDDEGNEVDPRDQSDSRELEHTRKGVTVQLPTFSFTTVTTTVSVPDGGTVLLGGIKRLMEGRNEYGTPFMSKLPYINRLFTNVGIGRHTQSLMMMVTPRIIIQEEEEEFIGTAQEIN